MAKSKKAAKGAKAPGGSWRGGIPAASAGSKTGYTPTPGAKPGSTGVHGASTANMGDGTPTNGHNLPRGYAINPSVGKRNIASQGSSPISRKGR